MKEEKRPKKARSTDQARDSRRKPRAAVSARLPGGELAEMIHQREEGRTAFLVFASGVWREEREVELAGGRRLRPYSAANSLLEHRVVLFPSWVAAYGSDEELLADIRAFLHRYVDVSTSFEEIAAHYVLLSWVYEDFEALPYLRVRGDYGSGKSRFLKTVGALIQKPIFASGASSVSSLFRMLDAFRGTLVLDESDFRATDEKADIAKILNNGNARGFPVLRTEQVGAGQEFAPRAFDVFGPKILATRRYFEDTALESRCITEELVQGRIRQNVPLALPESFEAEAEKLRNRLLLWRFLNAGKRKAREASLSGLEPRVAQVFAPLYSTALDEGARKRILDRATEAGRRLAAERGESLEADLVSVIRELQEAGEVLAVSAIARRFQERFGEEYDRKVTPRWVGFVLRRRLFLHPRKSRGVYAIGRGDLPRLRRLCERYSPP